MAVLLRFSETLTFHSTKAIRATCSPTFPHFSRPRSHRTHNWRTKSQTTRNRSRWSSKQIPSMVPKITAWARSSIALSRTLATLRTISTLDRSSLARAVKRWKSCTTQAPISSSLKDATAKTVSAIVTTRTPPRTIRSAVRLSRASRLALWSTCEASRFKTRFAWKLSNTAWTPPSSRSLLSSTEFQKMLMAS